MCRKKAHGQPAVGILGPQRHSEILRLPASPKYVGTPAHPTTCSQRDRFARAGLHGGGGDARKHADSLFPAWPDLTKTDGRKRPPLRAHTLARPVSMEALCAPDAFVIVSLLSPDRRIDNRIGIDLCARGFERAGGKFSRGAARKSVIPCGNRSYRFADLLQTVRNCDNPSERATGCDYWRESATTCEFLRLLAVALGGVSM